MDARTHARSAVASLILLIAAFALPRSAEAGGPFASDKLTHFSVSVPFGMAGTAVADQFIPEHRFIVGTLLGTVPGLAVEIGDATTSSGFDPADLLADFIGAALGAIATDQVILRFFFDDRGPDKGAGVEVGGVF
ncbi:MAG TPA: hypothetical protein VFD92_00480 [Candidatus Binatia bacterium]|nr:hypothetical protein [Candidatus Binatia bacterium]